MRRLLVITFLCSIHGSFFQASASPWSDAAVRLPYSRSVANQGNALEKKFVGQRAPYVFSFVRYESPETSKIGQDVRLRLYVFSFPNEIIYNGPASIEVIDRGVVLQKKHFDASDAMSLYEIHQVLPEASQWNVSRFSLRVTLHGANEQQCTIPFHLSSQEIPWGKWMGGFLVVILLLAIYWIRKNEVPSLTPDE